MRIEPGRYGVRCLCLLLAMPSLVIAAGHLDSRATTMSLQEATRGVLLAPGDTPGRYRPLPTVGTDVTLDIAGTVAHVSLRQQFRNPGDTWAFWYAGNAMFVGVTIAFCFFGLIPDSLIGKAIFILAMAALLIGTMPYRKCAGIALDYLSRLYLGSDTDEIPPLLRR